MGILVPFTNVSNYLSNNVELPKTVADNPAIQYNDNLESYLRKVRRIFDVSRIIDPPQDNPQVIRYYQLNRITYKLAYNWQGFIHCGISYDGTHKKGDCEEQARIVERYIQEEGAKKVLELGYGTGINSAFLARRNPAVTFEAIDLSDKPLKRFTKMPNLRFNLGDYHDLSRFDDGVYDVVFVIEALCYSTDKPRVLREVKKKLRPGGLFIVIDAYQRDRATPLSQSEDVMWRLVSKGAAVEKFEQVDDVEGYMRQEYSVLVSKDFTQCVLPSLRRQETKALYYFDHPHMASVINKFLPFDVVKNTTMILFMPTSIVRQVACYYVHVLRNDR